MDKTKWCNGFYIQFRQSFAKETFSYDEHLKCKIQFPTGFGKDTYSYNEYFKRYSRFEYLHTKKG